MAEEDIALRVSIKDRALAARDVGGIKRDVAGLGDTATVAGTKAEKSSRGWSRLSGSMGALARRGAVVGGALALAGAAAGKGLYSVGKTFDDVSDTIRVGTGATGKHLAALEASAKRVGRSVPAAFSDIGPVVADVNTRLGLTGPTLEKVSKQILEAGRMTGQAIDVNAVSGAFNAFQVKGKDTAGAMDTLYQVSQATGLGINELATSVSKNGAALKGFGFSLEESASWIGTLDKAGLDGDKTLGTLSRAMSTFAKDGKDPQEALRGTVDQIEKLTKSGKDAAAINLAGEVFGTRGATQFVGAIKSGKVDLDALTKATGATSDTILKAGRDTADFSEHWQKFKNRALIALEPVAKRVFGALGDGMKMINRDVVPAVKTFIDQMRSGEGIGGKFARAFEFVRDVLGKVAGVIRGALSGSAGDASTYLGDIVDTIKSVVSIAQSLWATFGGTITRYTQSTFTNIKTVIGGALKVISGIFQTVSALLKGDWSGAWDGIKKILAGAVDILKGIIKQLWNYLRTAFSIGLTVVKGIFGRLWDGVKELASRGVDGVVGFVKSMPDRLKSLGGTFLSAGKTLMAKFFDGLRSLAGKGGGMLADVGKTVLNGIVDILNLPIRGMNTLIPDKIAIPGAPDIDLPNNPLPTIPKFAAGGIVQRRPGGMLGIIGEGRHDEAIVPLNGQTYLIDRTGVTPLPQAAPLPSTGAADMPDLGNGEALGWGGTLHVHVEIEGRQVGEAVLDNFDDRAARR